MPHSLFKRALSTGKSNGLGLITLGLISDNKVLPSVVADVRPFVDVNLAREHLKPPTRGTLTTTVSHLRRLESR